MARRVDALKHRLAQDNGALHVAEFLTCIPNPVWAGSLMSLFGVESAFTPNRVHLQQ
jgi:hypothetical protein